MDPDMQTPAGHDQPATTPGSEPPQPARPADPRLGIEEFVKVELRAARVLSAERVPKSRKLMRLQIDLGTEQRTIVAGIAEAYEPEAVVGRMIAMVANLKPATLMGIESNGMILAASDAGGQPILMGFEREPAPGTRIK